MRLWQREGWSWAAALVTGLLLRRLFVWVHPRFVGDTLIYADLAHNLLAHGVYGLTEDHVRQTLIRLPGYPLFLALCFALFGTGNYLAVISVQVLVDLLGCWLLGRTAARVFGARVGTACVWMAALCPFTANYAAAALTETLSIFCVVLGFWAFVGWLARRRADGTSAWGWGAGVGVACAGAVLLRPDGILLGAVLLLAMGWVAWRGRTRSPAGSEARGVKPGSRGVLRAFAGPLMACGLLCGCLGVWAVRNWRVFHVFQPLAPKYANDPGEAEPLGFARWYRTWGAGLADTARVYWEYDGSTLAMKDLPPWAFDSAAQRAETAAVIARYNEESSLTPASEADFARLAAERIRAHPVRYYVVMPLVRIGDMWLRPRTELLPRMPLDWWKARIRPRAAVFALAYGLLNVMLLGVAGMGLMRWWRSRWRGYGVLAAAMVGFVVLRSGLLMTIDNSEPRYVLECYPVVLMLAALGVTGLPARLREGRAVRGKNARRGGGS